MDVVSKPRTCSCVPFRLVRLRGFSEFSPLRFEAVSERMELIGIY
ncbi:hypothetical protein DsansV1_C13g0122591 [Dioscorea sansibarensis]